MFDTIMNLVTGAMPAVFGGLAGGILRAVPEFMKLFDRASERKHELAMQDKALAFEKLRGAARMDEINAMGQASWNAGTMDALKESVAAQGKMSGVKWIDALSVSVRPFITYAFMMLYTGAKVAAFIATFHAGEGWIKAVLLLWTEADQVMWAGMLNFWFLGRVFEKAGRL